MQDILKPFGKTDVLSYYSAIANKLKNFLKNKEIASKVWLPFGFFIKRGSKAQPLYIEEFSVVDNKLLELRSKTNLKRARDKITKQQDKIWGYFPQAKLIDFFYATNREGKGKPIDRIFFDIDRGKGTTAQQTQQVIIALIKTIRSDKEFKKLIKFKTFLMWTGKSFHLYLMLNKAVPQSFYQKYISCKKDKPLESFTGRWAQKISKETKIKVKGGHEKTFNTIIIDPSQTPSGKLARCPFSLHMKSPKEVDGISVPLNEKMLQDKTLVKKLESLTPEKVIKNLNRWARNLPK
ncbi:MAG: hypothetical protein IB618_00400 [Candidatus Pacearchaeota archaeon]|nr:MAG: hypothetical protein IB618_00400 [Candidatus Pacearchaeota archaeon]